jgi:hypothetical protein
MVNEINQEAVLANQIPDFDTETKSTVTEEVAPINDTKTEESYVGKKISHNIGGLPEFDNEGYDEFVKKTGASTIGSNLLETTEARAGWTPIDRRLLGERNRYYPEDWVFYVRPATVEVVRNWSMLDENNGNSIDDVFNEILKYCLSIKTATGSQPWQAINNWDRFFFVLLIREYTFVKGESNVEYYEDCANCETPVKFILESQALMYDMPDESVHEYYDRENRVWVIDPADFELPSDRPINLYLPSVEKDANIKAWLIAEYQENDKRKFDNVFFKFLPWLCPKISKDFAVARTQIRKAEMTFKSWDSEMFSFMNDVLKNISVTPATTISAICPGCGEEAVTKLRFPDGVSSLFNVVDRRKKFGTK